jgi:hypothetical protein
MAKFQKGHPKPKNSGRKPGSINRITRSVKAAFEAAFKELQADPKTELVAWAKKNKGNLREFYKIAARFIPAELAVDLQAQVTVTDEPPSPLELARRFAHLRALISKPQADPGKVLPHEQHPVIAEFVEQLPAYAMPRQAAPQPAEPVEPEQLGGDDPDRDVF